MYEPLSLHQGDKPALEVACRVAHADGSSDPIDLTGANVRWVSKPQRADPDSSGVIITGTVVNKPAQGIDATDGLALIQITSAVTGQGARPGPPDPNEELWASSSPGRARYGAAGTGGSLRVG